MEFEQKIRRILMERDLSRATIDKALGWPANTLGRYLAGGATMPVSRVLQLARYLHVSLDWLCDDAADWPPRDFRLRPMPTQAEETRLLVLRWVAEALQVAAQSGGTGGTPPDPPSAGRGSHR